MTVEDCWAMVESAEQHKKHCVLMENCNYDRAEMMVYNMVRQGVFGEILHAEGGYLM
jgi:predicted dehydrogenase